MNGVTVIRRERLAPRPVWPSLTKSADAFRGLRWTTKKGLERPPERDTTARQRMPEFSNKTDAYKIGVDDGARTHDHWNHNPGLYQLSYVHH